MAWPTCAVRWRSRASCRRRARTRRASPRWTPCARARMASRWRRSVNWRGGSSCRTPSHAAHRARRFRCRPWCTGRSTTTPRSSARKAAAITSKTRPSAATFGSARTHWSRRPATTSSSPSRRPSSPAGARSPWPRPSRSSAWGRPPRWTTRAPRPMIPRRATAKPRARKPPAPVMPTQAWRMLACRATTCTRCWSA